MNVTVEGRTYPVTCDDEGLYRAEDGNENVFRSNTLDGLRRVMTGMADRPGVVGNMMTQVYKNMGTD